MKNIEYHVQDNIGFITLNRPDKRNALSFETITELKAAFLKHESDPEVKVVVLNANGPVFCAGADLGFLEKLQDSSYEQNLEDSTHLKNLLLQIYTLKKVVVAQVHGHALAGGCGLTTVCDFVYTAPDVMFGYTEVKIGFIPAIVMIFLLRKIGEAKAKQLLLSGDVVSADYALQLGLVTKIESQGDLAESVHDFAQRLMHTNSLQAMMMTKEMIAEVQSLPLEAALTYAAEMNAKARSSEDCKRGVSAFLRKEKIVW